MTGSIGDAFKEAFTSSLVSTSIARAQKAYYDALMAQGFTDDQALHLVGENCAAIFQNAAGILNPVATMVQAFPELIKQFEALLANPLVQKLGEQR